LKLINLVSYSNHSLHDPKQTTIDFLPRSPPSK
jgi:hypothetical protein